MIRVEQSHLPVEALTHAGMTGKNNEDRYGVTALRLESADPASAQFTPLLLAVLCDGVGGHQAGEVASELAVKRITEQVEQSDAKNPAQILFKAIEQASQDIFDLSKENPDRRGMGSTCVCAWIIGTRLYAATVGDSRLYLMRGEQIIQLSTDHTWVQEMLEHGLIQPEEVNGHPNAHVIRRYLGSPSPAQADLRLMLRGDESDAEAEANQGMQLLPGDRLLLCSDGLTDLVQAEEILAAYRQQPPKDATQSLVDLANQRGGHDNITLVTIQMPPPPPAPEAAVRPAFNWKPWAMGCLGVLGVAGLITAALIGWMWLRGSQPERKTPTPLFSPATQNTLAFPTLTAPVQSPVPSSSAPKVAPALTQSAPAVQKSPTTQPAAPSKTAQPAPSTPTQRPTDGPTLTPWPTNTLKP